ncbi:Endo-1,3-1,4-beta-D-glucanase [Glycine soja]
MSGPECCSNPPVLNPNARVGHVEKLAGLNSYLSSSLNSNAILLISDIYGYEAPNLRYELILKSHTRLQLLVVPDFSHGDPYNPKNASRSIPVWLKDHGTDKGFEVAKSIIEALKSKGMMAIGAITFFGEWGDKS